MNGVPAIIFEGLSGGVISVLQIALIVIPLMVLMEVAKDLNIMDRLTDLCRPLTDILGISKASALPLAVGLVFGLAYGAGVIIQSAKQREMNGRDLLLVCVFLGCCHAVFEDSLLFVPVGVNAFWLLAIRIVTAFVVTTVLSRIIKTKQREESRLESSS